MATDPEPAGHEADRKPERSVPAALRCGWAQRCPACGKGALYRAFLKVHDSCPACGEVLHHQRADDAPAYFTMVIVAHIVVGGLLSMEQALAPEPWVQIAVWIPATVLLSLLLLPRVKGMLVALQWALRMHGFGGKHSGAEPGSAADYVHPEMRERPRIP